MSEWIALSAVENHLIDRLGGPNSYRSLRRYELGVLDDAIAAALCGGSIRVRGYRGAGKQILAIAPGAILTVRLLASEVILDGQCFTEVEIGARQFNAYCDEVLDLGAEPILDPPIVTPLAPRISHAELVGWINSCPTENSKAAYKLLRDKFGKRAPKRQEEFMPAWQEAKGHRPRGRMKKSPN